MWERGDAEECIRRVRYLAEGGEHVKTKDVGSARGSRDRTRDGDGSIGARSGCAHTAVRSVAEDEGGTDVPANDRDQIRLIDKSVSEGKYT